MESPIPVVDFSQMSLKKGTDHEDYAPESIQQLADEIHRAFSTVGFVYLKNHGIPQQKVREFTERSFLFPWLYTYLTISFILSPAMMFTTSESVTRLQEVTILILQDVRNLGTTVCSDPHHKVITFETHPLHPWMRFSEGLDRGDWEGGVLYL